jgi:hypothetical protein
VLNADVATAIRTAVVFSAPVGAIAMHRHYRGATGALRWFIVTLRVLALVAAPFAVLMLIGAIAQILS